MHAAGPTRSRACRWPNSCWRGPLRLHRGNRCSGFRWRAWYWRCWISVAKLSPAACLVELGEQGRLPLAQAQQVVFGILTREHAPLLRNPDDLALVLVALMLMAMAAGFMLWRAIVRERQVQSRSP